MNRACRAHVAVLAFSFTIASSAADPPASDSSRRSKCQAHLDAGMKAYSEGRHREAEQNLQLAIREAEAIGPDNELLADCLNSLGEIDRTLARYRDAVKHHERALAIHRKILGQEDSQVAIDLNNIGVDRQSLGEADQAVLLYKQALAIATKALGAEDPLVATIMCNMA